MKTAVTLPHRNVLRFVGKDAKTFIQGLFSNDVLQLGSDSTPIVYGAFLNGNGRVVTDGFVFYDELLLSDKHHTASQELFAEIDKEHTQKLITHLESFKMRADVKMSVLDDVTVQTCIVSPEDEAAIENMSSEGKAETKKVQQLVDLADSTFVDPRKSLENVRRIYYKRSDSQKNTPPTVREDDDPQNVTEKDAEEQLHNYNNDYLVHLYERGIAEGDTVWSHVRLPFEGNLDIVGGVHYQKGCYIGQELVQRAKNQLVTSKRLVPLQSNTTLAAGVELIHPKTSKSVGKVIDTVLKSGKGTKGEQWVGVCSLRLAEALNPETLDAILTVKGANNKVQISANVPYWWPDDEIDKCIPITEEVAEGEEDKKE